MSALSIQVPFPVFQDRDGQPLDNGYVWIGEPNLNPQTNPVVAYFDKDLTIPAAQPLRTINGYVSNAGTPAQIYVDGVNFSILVQDRKGTMVYNFPLGSGVDPSASGVLFTGFKGQSGFVSDLAGDDGSDWIGFQQAGTGTGTRSGQDKMRETVSVKDFGAKGDGVTDDYAAIQLAIAEIHAQGGGTLLFPKGVYFINRHKVIGGAGANGITDFTFTGLSGLVIEGNGSKLVMQGGWTRTADYSGSGFTYSYENQIGLVINSCVGVQVNNLEVDGGGATITKGATAEGISYGLMVLGSSQVSIDNVYIHHYCTDGLYLDKTGAYTSYIASKHVSVTNSKFSNNARQGCSVIQARYVTFTECEFSYTGQNGGYGAHAPAAGVDIEPNYYPGGGLANGDEATGDITFNSCRFIDNNGTEYVGTSYDAVPHPVIFSACTFRSRNAAGVKGIYPATRTTRFYGCHFDDVGMYPMFGTADAKTDTAVYGCTFTSLTPNKSLMYFPTYALATLTVSGCRFFLSSPTPRTQPSLYIQTAKCKFTDNYVFVASTEQNGTAWHTVGYLYSATLRDNKFDTDFAVGGKAFVIGTEGANEYNDTWANPTYLMWYPVAGYPQTNLSRGGVIPFETIKDWSTSAAIAFRTAAPSSGTWAKGSRVFNSNATVGSPKGWACTVAGTPGTWVSEGNL